MKTKLSLTHLYNFVCAEEAYTLLLLPWKIYQNNTSSCNEWITIVTKGMHAELHKHNNK